MGWLGRKDPLQIVTFRSYGTRTHLYARGRALEDEAIDLGRKGTLQLLLSTWKRFETDEVRNTPLRLTLGGDREFELKTDNDGYYLLDQTFPGLDGLADQAGWVPYTVSYLPEGLSRPILRENSFEGRLLIPPRSARYGIITDIDDTILHTGVTSYMKWQVIANTVFKRAESRMPLHGAPELYRQLHDGVGSCGNPVFYVSHSPWNLYRYLEYFLSKNDFPEGPILLRSMASFLSRKRGGPPHKQHEIENILKTYPELPFVLIGDVGERDADIYLDLSEKFPGRISAIYLRALRHKGRMRRVRERIAREQNVPVLLVQESEEVLEHARSLGLV